MRSSRSVWAVARWGATRGVRSGFGAYLDGHGGMVRFGCMSGGVEVDGGRIGADGLDAMLHGFDPSGGGRLRTVRDGQIGCYDIPLNDCGLATMY